MGRYDLRSTLESQGKRHDSHHDLPHRRLQRWVWDGIWVTRRSFSCGLIIPRMLAHHSQADAIILHVSVVFLRRVDVGY